MNTLPPNFLTIGWLCQELQASYPDVVEALQQLEAKPAYYVNHLAHYLDDGGLTAHVRTWLKTWKGK